MTPKAFPAAAKRRTRRKPRPPLPAPRWSACLYLRLAKSDVGMFRFLLEAEDNLGYMTVVDRKAAVVQFVFSPHQEKAARAYLESMRPLVPFSLEYDPAAKDFAAALPFE